MPVPKLRVSKSGRKRIDVPDLIAQLEADVRRRQLQVEEEMLRNVSHKVGALACRFAACFPLHAACCTLLCMSHQHPPSPPHTNNRLAPTRSGGWRC
jgi:hypothetical protein